MTRPPAASAPLPIRVLVADDHALFRAGLRRILGEHRDVALVGEAADGHEAVQLTCTLRPDVVLLDLKMPGLDGIAACRAIQERCPAAILILTVSDQDEDLFSAIRAGARGYLLKQASETELLAAIRRVAAGEAVLSPALAGRLLQELAGHRNPRGTGRDDLSGANAAPSRRLSRREVEILQLAARGLTNGEIARQLQLSPNTVKTHLRRVLSKLHARNRAEAAALATRQGLVGRRDETYSSPPVA